jgi:hypothetical protein
MQQQAARSTIIKSRSAGGTFDSVYSYLPYTALTILSWL